MAMARFQLAGVVVGLTAACVLGRSGFAAGDERVPGSGEITVPAAAMHATRPLADFETALDELTRRAEAGDAAAQWSLGMRYRFGVGAVADMDAAREWLKRAAEADHAEACRAYAWTLVADGGDKAAIAEASRWMERAAEFGNLDAMVEETDLTTATSTLATIGTKLRVAAEKGAAGAQARFGMFGSAGMIGAQNKEAAERFLRTAADAGCPLAAEFVGMALISGTRTSEPSGEDVELGIRYLRHAAEYGRPNAQYYLGSTLRRIARDQGTVSDEGMRWLVQAAEQNNIGGLTRLGGMYLSGDGVPKDVAKGAELIGRSAGIGALYTAVSVGSLYERGEDVGRDVREAMKWYSKGAQFGDVEAQLALARLMSSGDGVEHDMVEAYKWANIAAAGGGEKEVAQRDAIGARLSGAEIQEGQARASRFRPTSLMSPAARPKMAPPAFQAIDGVVSGFFVSNDGYLITSSPLLAKARRVRVFAGGKPVEAVIVRIDAASEMALVKVATQTTRVPVARKSDFAGGPITASSFPAPWGEWDESSTRPVELATPGGAEFTWLQVDARAGNSGGALMNAEGEAIGVMTHRVAMMSAMSPPEVRGDMAGLFSALTPAFGIDRASSLLTGVFLDGPQPTDPKAIGPIVVVLIEL